MMERLWARVPAIAFTSDGKTNGEVTVNNACSFKVGQSVTITAIGKPTLVLKVKRVPSPTVLLVGPASSNIKERTDISQYTVALMASISAQEQPRPPIDEEDINRATYEEEPTVAWRVFNVDKSGNPYSKSNPFPVELSDGSISIGTVNAELEVQLSHIDDSPDSGDVADSVQVGDGEEIIQVNPDGSINTKSILPNSEGLNVVDLVNTATEYNFTFPNKTKYYKIKVRNSDDVVRVGLNAGDIASGDYFTIERGNIYSPDHQNDFEDGYTLYFETKSKNNIKLEVIYYYIAP